jgi:hypothetical protein
MRIALIIIWLFILFCLSMAPFEVKLHLKTMGRMHNAGHFLAFTFTALLFAWDSKSVLSRIVRCCLALLVALGAEYLEFYEYRNPYEWGDVLIDSAAIVLVFLILTLWSILRSQDSRPPAIGRSV